MPYTVRDSVKNLLELLDPDQRVIPARLTEDDPLPSCLMAINGALTELNTIGPLWQFRGRRSAIIHAPKTISIPVLTQYESGFTLTAPAWEDWMVGCSIQIGSESTWNEIVKRTDDQVTLLHPILGTSGTNVSATVYCDCIQLSDDVLQVMSPVSIADGYELLAANNLTKIHSAQYDYWRTDDYGRSAIYSNARRRTTDSPGPRLYWHDTQFDGATNPAASRLRLGPMPIAQAILHYRARISPPTFTTADVYSDPNSCDDPSTLIPIRQDLVETIFQPIARQRFTASPYMRNDNALPEIKRQYEMAYAIAKSMTPQTSAGSCIQPGY